MKLLMTLSAEGDEIFLGVVPQLAPPLDVVDLKILRPPARLATPAVSLEDLPAKLTISFRSESQAWPFCLNSVQGAT
jgi:hypothetical protein